jgi:hypothetical protein
VRRARPFSLRRKTNQLMSKHCIPRLDAAIRLECEASTARTRQISAFIGQA